MKWWMFLWSGLLLAGVAKAQQATWIWYPGDYEIWLGNEMNNRRTERGAFFPPFWKMDNHYVLVEFSKELELAEPEEVEIYAEGRFNVKLDGKLQGAFPYRLTIPAGRHQLNIKVHNQAQVPAVYVRGRTVCSDTSWRVTFEDKEWIDESGKASDKSATVYMNAGSWNFDDPYVYPSQFRLQVKPQPAVSVSEKEKGWLVDFGRETFGYICFHGLKGTATLKVYYGETPEEALATETCETLDRVEIEEVAAPPFLKPGKDIKQTAEDVYTLEGSRAFRYVYVEKDRNLSFDSISMLYEYLPLEYRGAFRCNDEELNRIWDISAYTLHLTTREFFIDGIKRDRWVWSGDAYQSFLMNYYLFFDSPSVTRTLWLLRGKDPVTSHINTIMDYTFYWFLGVYDYYLYTGDVQAIRQLYPRMESLMEYVLGRRNAEGMVEGLTGDWVFVDWADGYLDKKGELSFEQILFCKSLETMAVCADLLGKQADREKYDALAKTLKDKLALFWNEEKQAFVHNRIQGQQSESVTRYANMFAIFFDYLDADQKRAVKTSVLQNDSILKITTPYMRFYELEALCALGEQRHVMQEMKDYWGGMLHLGATSFWEKYNPSEQGMEHYAMYGRPFGKSLCHAWGASPIYLLGKYYLGVKPVKPGYREFSITPELGGLKWMEGTVPTLQGEITVFVDTKTVRVKASAGEGWLVLKSRVRPAASAGQVEALGRNEYRIRIFGNGEEVKINYRAI